MNSYPDEYRRYAVTLSASMTLSSVRGVLSQKHPEIPAPSTRSITAWKNLYPEETPEEKVLVFDEARSERLIGAENKALKKQIKLLEKRADVVAQVSAAVERVEAAPTVIIRDRLAKSGTMSSGIFGLQDWHHNERVEAKKFVSTRDDEFDLIEECFNAYDLDIAERRIVALYDIMIDQVESYKSPRNIERLIFAFKGDLVNGDIHHASVTNCTGSAEAAMILADIIAREFLRFREVIQWSEIDILFVGGNHGRIQLPHQQRAVNAKTVTSNYDWIVGQVVKRKLEGQENLSVECGEAPASMRSIYGHNHYFEHGDAIRGGGGIAELPMFGLATHQFKKSRNMLQETGTRLDHFHIGHLHKYAEMPFGRGTLTIGPSLIGATERGSQLGYSGQIAQNLVWCTENHPFGARYALDVPSCI